ncbi:hypothetical protein CQ045_01690 [Microbacterium sp. MYb66]|nr:hypothetical protein CQ045_01690 [Microbacterium sp. MYb66]
MSAPVSMLAGVLDEAITARSESDDPSHLASALLRLQSVAVRHLLHALRSRLVSPPGSSV